MIEILEHLPKPVFQIFKRIVKGYHFMFQIFKCIVKGYHFMKMVYRAQCGNFSNLHLGLPG